VTDLAITDFDVLVDRYADRIRTDAIHGRERSYAAGFIDAMTDIESRYSNAKRQQRAAAILAAADRVRTERLEVLR
jgi:hypothetical protein